MKKIFLALWIIMTLPIAAQAAENSSPLDYYQFDKTHTEIMFFVDHLGYSKKIGRFQDYSGGYRFYPARPEQSRIDVTIKTASVDTNVKELDDKLAGKDNFNSAEFPDARFVSTKIEKTGANTGKVTGDFTLMGVTKPVTLDVTFNKAAPFPFGDKYVSGFSARGTIFRSAFNYTNMLPMVGDQVDLVIEAEGVREKPAAKQN